MWIVRIALTRPYTFIVLALLILCLSPLVILRTPADIFPAIDIPVIAVTWSYTGLNPEEMEGRLTTPFEKSLSWSVDNVEHSEATTYDGEGVIKIFLQPHSSVDTANAQVTAVSQFMLRQMPQGTQPPQIIDFSASSVPVLQLGISGKGLSEQQLNDYAKNVIEPQLSTVHGIVLPNPYGGKQVAVMVNLNPNLMQSKGSRLRTSSTRSLNRTWSCLPEPPRSGGRSMTFTLTALRALSPSSTIFPSVRWAIPPSTCGT